MADPVTIGNATLYHGDALEILADLHRVADLAVTDVPYRLTNGGSTTEVMTGIFSHESYDNSGDLVDTVAWSEIGGPIYRACKANADCYVMANDKNVFLAHGGFIGAGWQFHNLLVWDKVRATRNRWYMKNLEFTLYLWKGRAKPISDCGSKQLFTLNAPKVSDHPTEKPADLMAYYIANSSKPGDVVLDPFMGSGTTGVAALGLGRRFIGIEKDAHHFDTACRRLEKMLHIDRSFVCEGVRRTQEDEG